MDPLDAIQQKLPGLTPLAKLSLTAYVMPDGRISHYEAEGRDPAGSLVHFRAQADGHAFIHSPTYAEVLAHWEEELRAIPIED